MSLPTREKLQSIFSSCDQPLDHIDASVEGLVERVGGRLAVLAGHDRIVLGKAVVAHAAIAAGRGVADRFGLQQGNLGAFLGDGQRRGGSGQAATHDRHIVVAFERFGRPSSRTAETYPASKK